MLHPLLVIEVPADRLFNADFECRLRIPAHLSLDFIRRDRVSSVVTFAVLNVLDQILGDVLLSRITVVKFLTQSGNNRLYDLDILPLIMAADVICLEESSLLLHKVNTLAVIFDIQPVTDVLSVAVYREGLASGN